MTGSMLYKKVTMRFRHLLLERKCEQRDERTAGHPRLRHNPASNKLGGGGGGG